MESRLDRVAWALALVWLLWLFTTCGILANTDSLWLDELTSYWFSNTRSPADVFTRMLQRSDPHPPGYQLLLHFYLKLPGASSSSLALRGLSLFALALTLLSGSLLANRIAIHHRRAATLFLLSYGGLAFVSFYATETRAYMWLQALLLMMLLFSDQRRERAPESFNAALPELFAALGLATFHYVGALAVAIHAFFDASFAMRNLRWKSALARLAGYALGPAISTAWLVLAPRAGAFRTLPDPSWNRVFDYFVNAVGKVQIALLAVTAFALCLLSLTRTPITKGALHVVHRSGALMGLTLFVSMVVISLRVSVLQERNVLLVVAPLALLLSTTLADAPFFKHLRAEMLLLMVAVPAASIETTLRLIESPNRARENFSAMAHQIHELQLPTVVLTDDLAQKLVDAGRLRPLGKRTLSLPTIYAPSFPLGTGAALPLDSLPRKGKVVFACPHCKQKSEVRLRETMNRVRAGRCGKPKKRGRDRLWVCQFTTTRHPRETTKHEKR